MHSRSEGSPGFRASPSTGSEYRLSLTCVVMLESSPVSQHVAVSITPSIWIDSGSSGICISSSRSLCSAVVPGVFACVHMYMLHVCACMCVCMYVYRHACMYVYACARVYVFVCMYIRLYMNVYAYLCIGCESQCQCLCVLGGVMNARVCSCAYVCVCMCVCTYLCAFFCSECCVHFGTGVLGTSAWAEVYVTQVCFLHQRTHLRTHSLQVVHMCVYEYICIYACICMWTHI